ncbi:MAG TPA: M48 family metallopeptidase [Isosphaeraceae bacterium]|nr:M48 family metallopeptidase [Isosphaeraceae bacterium]
MVRPSLLYRFWILIVASVMVLLPLIYLGIVGLACYGMYWHATHNHVVLRTVNGMVALLFYAGPLAVFAVLIFFLLKPLFARPGHRSKRRSLDPSREPLLFAFVGSICSAVGAPTPVRIDVDCDVNASASPEHGLFSLLRRRLVLTVGLPLAATLDIEQFAGVLAHEFGHFSQSAGMQLTYLVRSINAWFSRVVYERDEWDATLDAWSHKGQGSTMLIANLARLGVWLTRRILWMLMMVGHAISCTMLRQMEYDADRYQARLVGSALVESILKRINVVMVAQRGAFSDLSENWKEGRLADDLPHLISANVPQIPQPALEAVDAMLAQGKTRLFDTHPADKDRIRATRAENCSGIFHLDGPATDLFREFENHSRTATIDHYRSIFGPGFTPDQLQPVAEVVRGTEHAQAGHEALKRFFLGRFNAVRAIPMAEETPTCPADPKTAVRRLKQVRGELPTAQASYGAAVELHGSALGKLIRAEAASMLSKAHFKFKATDYELPAATLEAARSASESASRVMTEQTAALAPFEHLCSDRLSTALSLLEVDAAARRLADPEGWRREVRSLYPVASFLAIRIWPKLLPLLQARVALLAVLKQYEGNEQNQRLNDAILRGGRELKDRLQELSTALQGGMLYPFDHAQGEVTLGRFAIPSVPDSSAIGDLLRVGETALDRLVPLYARILGRLALAAEEVERALGLPPLECELQSATDEPAGRSTM